VGLPLWSSGQSFWLQIKRSWVRFPAFPIFLRSSGSGTGSTQPREDNWGATCKKEQPLRSRKPRLTTGGTRCADHATSSIRKSWHYIANKRRSLGRHSSLADQSHVFFPHISGCRCWTQGREIRGNVTCSSPKVQIESEEIRSRVPQKYKMESVKLEIRLYYKCLKKIKLLPLLAIRLPASVTIKRKNLMQHDPQELDSIPS
jgi:hypothetical protein